MATGDNGCMTVIPDDCRPLAEVVAELPAAHGRIDVTHDGRQVAAVVSAEYLDSLHETLDVAADPDLVAEIATGREEVARGEIHSLDEVLREFGVQR